MSLPLDDLPLYFGKAVRKIKKFKKSIDKLKKICYNIDNERETIPTTKGSQQNEIRFYGQVKKRNKSNA